MIDIRFTSVHLLHKQQSQAKNARSKAKLNWKLYSGNSLVGFLTLHAPTLDNGRGGVCSLVVNHNLLLVCTTDRCKLQPILEGTHVHILWSIPSSFIFALRYSEITLNLSSLCPFTLLQKSKHHQYACLTSRSCCSMLYFNSSCTTTTCVCRTQ